MNTNTLYTDFMYDLAVAVGDGALPDASRTRLTDYIISYFRRRNIACYVNITEFLMWCNISLTITEDMVVRQLALQIKDGENGTIFYFTDADLVQIQIDKVSAWILSHDTYVDNGRLGDFLCRNRFNSICPQAPTYTFTENNYLQVTFPFYLNNVLTETTVSFTLTEDPNYRISQYIHDINGSLQDIVSEALLRELNECPGELLKSHIDELHALTDLVKITDKTSLPKRRTVFESCITQICRTDDTVSEDRTPKIAALPWTAVYQHEVFPKLPEIAYREHVTPGARRTYVHLRTLEEHMLDEAIAAIERIGDHPLLTVTVQHLEEAKKALADWIDHTPQRKT